MELSFRPIADESEDVWKIVLDWRNSLAVRTQMLDQSFLEWEGHCRWIKSQRDPESRCLAQVVYGENKPLGVVSLNKINIKHGHSDWGMYIGRAEMRGQGLGKIMLDEILRWGFVDKKLLRLYTSVLADNFNALRLYLKKGFRLEGNWRDHVLFEDGRRVDLIWIGMSYSFWNKTI